MHGIPIVPATASLDEEPGMNNSNLQRSTTTVRVEEIADEDEVEVMMEDSNGLNTSETQSHTQTQSYTQTQTERGTHNLRNRFHRG